MTAPDAGTEPMALRPTLLPRDRQPVVPWRNGGGSTRQVAIDPPDASVATLFRWRVSVASVASDGPFSCFAGVDRSLWLVRGNGMRLEVGGKAVRLDQPLQRLDFPGEAAIGCRLIDGPCEDCNVMMRRDAVTCHARVKVLSVGVDWRNFLQPGAHVVLLLAGAATLATPASTIAMAEGDAIRLDGDGETILTATPPRASVLLTSFHKRQ